MENRMKRVCVRLSSNGSQLVLRGTAGELGRALRASRIVQPLYDAALERAEEALAWGLVGSAREQGYSTELTIAVQR